MQVLEGLKFHMGSHIRSAPVPTEAFHLETTSDDRTGRSPNRKAFEISITKCAEPETHLNSSTLAVHVLELLLDASPTLNLDHRARNHRHGLLDAFDTL